MQVQRHAAWVIGLQDLLKHTTSSAEHLHKLCSCGQVLQHRCARLVPLDCVLAQELQRLACSRQKAFSFEIFAVVKTIPLAVLRAKASYLRASEWLQVVAGPRPGTPEPEYRRGSAAVAARTCLDLAQLQPSELFVSASARQLNTMGMLSAQCHRLTAVPWNSVPWAG